MGAASTGGATPAAEPAEYAGSTRQQGRWWGTVAGQIVSGPHRTRGQAQAAAHRAARVLVR